MAAAAVEDGGMLDRIKAGIPDDVIFEAGRFTNARQVPSVCGYRHKPFCCPQHMVMRKVAPLLRCYSRAGHVARPMTGAWLTLKGGGLDPGSLMTRPPDLLLPLLCNCATPRLETPTGAGRAGIVPLEQEGLCADRGGPAVPWM